MASLFDICAKNLDTYLCVKDFNEDTHEATLISTHPTSSLNEVKSLAAEGYTIIYSTPRGGYVPVSSFDGEFITGQVHTLEDAFIHNPDRYVYYFVKERAHSAKMEKVIFIGAVTREEDDEYVEGLVRRKSFCSYGWTTPMGGICLWL